MSAAKFTKLAMTALRSNFSRLPHPYKLTLSITYKCQSRCTMCVRPEEIILGDNERISTLAVGDHAIGRTGLNEISNVFSRGYEGKLFRIKAAGLLPIEVTPEHPILISRSYSSRNHNLRHYDFSKPEWTEAKEITTKNSYVDGDYLCTPIIERSENIKDLDLAKYTKERGAAISRARGFSLSFPLDDETAWLLGVYTAEGCPASNGARFAFNVKEIDLHGKVKKIGEKLGYSVYNRDNGKNCMVCCISSPVLARALSTWCGKGATNKKIPDFILLHKKDSILKAFLKGWEDGDAYLKNGLLTGSTVSKTLALQLQLAYASLGIDAKVNFVPRKEAYFYEKPINVHDVYVVKYYVDPKRNNRYVHKFGKYLLHPIRKIERIPYRGEVCNIETSDNTYLVSNAVVHNCNIWTMKPVNELTIDEIREFAQKNNYFKWLEITGGEPFLRGDIVEIIKTFKESCKDLYVLTMPTNSLCNKEMELSKMEEILKLGIPRVVVTISLDGYRELHDKIRGVPGNFDKAIAMFKGLQELKKRYKNLDMVFGYTMIRANQGQLERTYEEVKKLVPEITHNTFHINLGQTSEIYYSNANMTDLKAARESLANEIAGFIGKREKTMGDVTIIERAFLKKLAEYVKTDEPPMKSRSLDASLFMDSYGNVYPSIMWGRKIGNVRETGFSLGPLWDNSEAQEVRDLIKQGKEPKGWTACEAYQTLVGDIKSML